MNLTAICRALALGSVLIASPAVAQWQVPLNSVPIGRGPGVTGFLNVPMGAGTILIGQAGIPQAIAPTGDVTISAPGVTAIGTAKVTYAMRANVGALSVNGRSANSTGVAADISCSAGSDAVLRESGSVLGCGTIATAGIAANAVTNAKLATVGAATLKGNPTASAGAAVTDFTIQGLTARGAPDAANDKMLLFDAAAGTFKYVTPAQVAAAATAGVSTIAGNTGAFTLNGTSGITNTVNDIILSPASSSQFGAVKVDNVTILATAGVIGAKATTLTNSLSGDVALNNTANYFDGPIVAQGTSGTWLASGTVTIGEITTGDNIFCKLWDGTTVISSTAMGGSLAAGRYSVSLSGTLASPAASIRISCRDSDNTTGLIRFNASGNSKDSTITVQRIQ